MPGRRLIDDLSDDVRGRLAAAGRRERVPAGTVLFHIEDPPSAVYVIETGLVRVDRSTPAGRRVLITLACPGELVGELPVIDDSPRSASATAVVSTRMLIVPGRAFLELMASEASLANAVARHIVRRLRRTNDQLVSVSATDARSRIAACLLDLADVLDHSLDGPTDLRLPISQEDLGHWVGLSREGAVRGIRELRDAGVIETGRKRVHVIDPGALRTLANASRR